MNVLERVVCWECNSTNHQVQVSHLHCCCDCVCGHSLSQFQSNERCNLCTWYHQKKEKKVKRFCLLCVQKLNWLNISQYQNSDLMIQSKDFEISSRFVHHRVAFDKNQMRLFEWKFIQKIRQKQSKNWQRNWSEE